MIMTEVLIRLGASSTSRVQLGSDGVNNALHLRKLLLQILRARTRAVLLDPVRGVLDRGENDLLVLVRDLATESLLVAELRLEPVDEGGKGVESLDTLALGLVLGSELLGVGDHAVNVLLAETALLVGDGDRLGLASSLVSGGDLHDTVGINLEGDLDLRNTTGRRGDAGKLELAEMVVVLGERTFTLEDLDKDGRLVVGGGGEDLALPGGDDGVTGDELGEDTTGGLDTEGEGADIDEDDISGSLSSREDTTLDGSTVGDGLIGVDSLGGLLAVEVLLEELLDLGDTGRTTDKNDLVDILLLDVGILQHLLDGLQGLAEEVDVELLELGASKGLREVVTVLEGFDFDADALLAGESALGLLNFTLELAESTEVLRDVGAGLLLVLLDEVLDDTVIEILTAEMGVTSGGQDLEDTVVDGEKGDIESSSSEIVDDDLGLTALLVETVGDGGSGGLVDDTEDMETGDGTGILGGLALSVVEVGGDGDDGVGDLVAKVGLSGLLHLAKDHGGNLFGSLERQLDRKRREGVKRYSRSPSFRPCA
ncbi:hypothetical protein D9611_000923 [Ephemerocybe angulata]|uniref:Uncharacterized protein n=1 Tax=Ephemerocybe angulata TaxID=980116 RepID=A0A8H5BN91_9AGAR|nr:hypothetical protein D9611_000923 [Tulosesus angulatus]